MKSSLDAYVYTLISLELAGGDRTEIDLLLQKKPDVDDDLPPPIGAEFKKYLSNPGKASALALAKKSVRSFYFSNDDPEGHLLMVDQLLHAKEIDLQEAIDLFCLSGGQMLKMSNKFKDVIILSEALREDRDVFPDAEMDYSALMNALVDLQLERRGDHR